MPAAVGVDIGCGMIAVRTAYTRDQLPEDRRPLREAIERAVPLSAGAANRKISRAHTERRIEELTLQAKEAGFEPGDVREAAGSCSWARSARATTSSSSRLDELDRVWLFLHSGSRGVGNKIAQQHIRIAREDLCERRWIQLPDRDLAYLVEGTDEFAAYIGQMRWAQHYALLNREEMMDRVVRQFAEWVGAGVDADGLGDVERLEEINCHHNYTEQETHFGKRVWLSRKGAINAEAGRPGLIPGSMGTASYVVVGKRQPGFAQLGTARRRPGVLPDPGSPDLHARAAA
jgi:tRNA-splicing ligase RtcB